MKTRDQVVSLAATDLANHLSCRHLTTLDLRLAKGEIAAPSWENPHLRVLQQRGLEHEQAYIRRSALQRDSRSSIFRMRRRRQREATRAAMKSGAQAIVQASFASGDWRGRADVLLRVEQLEKPSRLGNWSYEVVDCKLARETKAETILQLCLYSELVAELQGLAAGILSCHPTERWLPARVLSAVRLRRILPRRQEGSAGRGESRFQRNIPRAGQSLRYLPVVERMRRTAAP